MKLPWLIISCLFCLTVIFGQEKVEVFTWHPDGKPVALYDDASLTKKRIDVYPDVEEGMAGMIFYIDVESDSCLRVITDPLDYLYVRKGTLAVNTRNYNNECFPLYEAPDVMSRPVFQSHVQQTVIVYGICDGWLFVEAQDEYQQPVRGWLPPNMQCGNPYTTCDWTLPCYFYLGINITECRDIIHHDENSPVSRDSA